MLEELFMLKGDSVSLKLPGVRPSFGTAAQHLLRLTMRHEI